MLAEKIGYKGKPEDISQGGTSTSEVVRSFTLELLGILGVGRRLRRYTAHSALTVPALTPVIHVQLIGQWEKKSTRICKICLWKALESSWACLSIVFKCLWNTEKSLEVLHQLLKRNYDGWRSNMFPGNHAAFTSVLRRT